RDFHVTGVQTCALPILRSDTGLITYDPGLANTASAKSAITFLDGDDAVLRYRGYPIEQLAEHSDFLETSFLLINGELPTAAEMRSEERRVGKERRRGGW